MPELFIFLLKVNAALLLFCLGYYLVLRRLTFYTLNRIYLVCAILFASIYPRINLSGFAERHRRLTQPVQNILSNWKTPAQNLVKPSNGPNYWHLAEVFFWMGVVLFATRLAMQLISLYKLYRSSKPGRINGYNVRLTDSETGPFSFWQSIYINPEKLGPADLKNILQHEQVHVNEWHTLDILLGELSTVFYWFNPGVWLMKKAIRENIEFITDRKILQKGADSRQYQYSMLNVSLANNQNPIVNHFNISTIKKRIIMMNTKRSSKFTLTRYAFVLPAVIVLLLIFSFSEAGIAKKGRIVFKNMAVNVSASQLTAGKYQHNNTSALISAKLQSALPLANTDTAAKGTTMDKTLTDVRLDSPLYVIDGVTVSKAKFKALDAKHIKKLAVVWGKDAKKFSADTSREVIIINSKDTLTAAESADAPYTITMNAQAPKARTLAKTRKVIVTSVSPKTAAKINIDEEVAPAISVDVKPSIVDSYNVTMVTPDVPGADNTPQILIKGITADSPESRVDNLSDKLIFIDGKQASEKDMKKLRAADIKSIDVNMDAKIKSQYGDKAKNGVIFITTKK